MREITTIAFLRTIFFVELIIACLAVSNGYDYLEWQKVSLDEIRSSPDAPYMIKSLLIDWSFFKGCCAGLTLAMFLLGSRERKSIAKGNWILWAHWLILVLPLGFLLWFGRNF